eukprot:TCONS_00051425-protein
MSGIAHECLQHGFVLGRSLGEGGYGQVKQASYVNFNCPNDTLAKRLRSFGHSDQVAIKIMKKASCSQTFEREVSCMLKLTGCRNVVQLFRYFTGENHVYLVIELCTGGDLITHFTNSQKINVKKIFQQIADGVQQMHVKGIAHRDLKPENVLIDRNGIAKISDFGTTIMPSSPDNLCNSYCGTPEYMAPEVLRGVKLISYKPYNPFKADMWSLGAILYSFLTGEFLPQVGSWKENLSVSNECLDLLAKLLSIKPSLRPTIGDIQRHPWLSASHKEPAIKQIELINNMIKEFDCLVDRKKALKEELTEAENKNKILKLKLGISEKQPSRYKVIVQQDLDEKIPTTAQEASDEMAKMMNNLAHNIKRANILLKRQKADLKKLNDKNVLLEQNFFEKILRNNAASNPQFPNGHHFPSTELWE